MGGTQGRSLTIIKVPQEDLRASKDTNMVAPSLIITQRDPPVFHRRREISDMAPEIFRGRTLVLVAKFLAGPTPEALLQGWLSLKSTKKSRHRASLKNLRKPNHSIFQRKNSTLTKVERILSETGQEGSPKIIKLGLKRRTL